MSERCVICDCEIPEGRQICPNCEKRMMPDVVAVTRCRDCKWFKEDDVEMSGYCEHLGIGTSMDEFCSDGRR